MALSIGISSGSCLQIGDMKVTVLDVVRGKAIRILAGTRTHVITDQQRTEIAPEVFVSYGSPTVNPRDTRVPRLAFEAPRSMKITRLPNVAV